LEKVLQKGPSVPQLKDDPQFARAMADLAKLGGGGAWARHFSRPSDAIRGPYELARAKQPATGWSSFLLPDPGSSEGSTAPHADPTKLPPFSKLAPYLAPVATFVTPVPNGWDVIGFGYKTP
jgi:hypothetical protein